MKRFNVCLLLSVVPLLCSCASTRQVTTLDPVGPVQVAADPVKPATDGTLKVYSLRGIYNDEGVNYHPHSDYAIYSPDGKRVKEVRNKRYAYDEEPVAVKLPAGNYTVEALAKGYKRVKVPVIIESGQLTAVRLESVKTSAVAKAKEPEQEGQD